MVIGLYTIWTDRWRASSISVLGVVLITPWVVMVEVGLAGVVFGLKGAALLSALVERAFVCAPESANSAMRCGIRPRVPVGYTLVGLVLYYLNFSVRVLWE